MVTPYDLIHRFKNQNYILNIQYHVNVLLRRIYLNGKTTELYPLKSKPPCNNPSFTGGVKGLASCRASYKHRPVGHLTRSHERETQGGIICLFILLWALTSLECERGLDKPFLLKKIRLLLIIFIKSTLKGAEFLGGNTLFNKSCMPCDRRKLWVGGGEGNCTPLWARQICAARNVNYGIDP